MLANRKQRDWRSGRQSKSAVAWKCSGGCLAFIFLAAIVCADSANAKYSGGNGDGNNPYLIATPSDMVQIGNNPDDWDKIFLQTSDIDMNDIIIDAFPVIGYLVWDPYTSKPFKGIFDGNKKRIFNLNIARVGHDYTGLFGYVFGKGALIKDLTLVNPKIDGSTSMYTGGIVGKLRYGTVSGCSVEGGKIKGASNVGGLVGYNLNGVITNCTVEAIIDGSTGIGGITGYHCGNVIHESGFSGTISGDSDIGGLAGDNDGQIEDCYAKGSVTGTGDRVAGLVGTSRGLVKYSYARATVTGNQQTGGLIGRNAGDVVDSYAQGDVTGIYYAGGLAGILYDQGTISRCYAVSNMNPISEQMGNLVGLADSGTVSASFSRDNASEAELLSEKTYTAVGWQFTGETLGSATNPWSICDGMNFPRLSWEKLYKGDWLCPDGVDILDIAFLCEQWLAKRASTDFARGKSIGIVGFQDWAIFCKAWKTKSGQVKWNSQCDVWPEGGDGVIDEMDLSVFINRWLTNGAGQGDIAPALRGDQIINFSDFAAAAENYQKQ